MREIALLYCGERAVTHDYRTAMLRVARSMEEAGIKPDTIESSSVNRWLAGLKQGPTTRSNYARMSKTLFAYCRSIGLTSHYPDRIVKVKPRPKPPISWTLAELHGLLEEAGRLAYTFKRSGCPASTFFRGFLLAGYETGLRFSDLHGLECHQLRDSRLYVVPNKTGAQVPKRLSSDCVDVLKKLSVLSGGTNFFRWAIAEKQLRAHWASLAKSAGVPGTPKWLRRTGATHVEKEKPGSAGRFLGHLSPGLAYKYYVDRTLIDGECPSPPEVVTS